jgi:hypothetical protein
VLDASYIIIGTRAVRVTIDFRIYARILLDIARKKERLREKKREKERKKERVYIFGVALYSIAREDIPEV